VTVPAGQAEVAALLRGLAGRDPVETHISAVFVGDDTVWKLKKAVRLSFVDFTTLAERERTARRELELNAPHAPGLYRDVVAVVRGAAGTLALGGEGAVVDWVVRMGRVPAGDFLDEVAARGGLDGGLQDALGDAVAAMHAAIAPVDCDHVAALERVVEGNARAAREAGVESAQVERWHAGARTLVAGLAGWLRRRAADGFVRRAHGDLHLGNLCLWRGEVVPFDALEFDEELATIDTGYDLAFLLMDLDVRVGRGAANRVMNRYLARTGDWGLVAGMRLFLSLRAMVRAHVEASRGRGDESAAYLARALEYQAAPAAQVVAVGGLPGTGKSTLARALAPGLGAAPGAVVLRSDEIRKRRHGAAPEVRLGAEAYAPAASAAVFAELFAAARTMAASGQAVVADATFMDAGHRAGIAAAAGDLPFLGVWLQAPLDVLERRVAGRVGDASDADVAVLRRAAAHDPGAGGWLAVDATDACGALGAVRAALDSAA
jgi:aminoglycoside phosphotransferase family enzyme/predicted kinase